MSRQDIEYNLSNRLSQENHSVLALMESFSENVSPLEADSVLREPAETQTRFLRGSLKSLQVGAVLEDQL